MTYRSILTYVDGDEMSANRMSIAASVARQFDAHLTALAVGYDHNLPAYAYGEAGISMVTELIDQAKDEAQERLQWATQEIAQAGVLGDAAPLVCRHAMMSHEIGRHARFADLVVLSQPYRGDNSQIAADAFEGALFDGGVPVLMCPPAICEVQAETVVIAWNYSQEALRAVRCALPYLRRAKAVEILMIESVEAQSDPGQRLATMLSRHGVSTNIIVQPRSTDAVSTQLMRRASELGAGLLVMGGYGHSRFREYVIGGATRDVLRNLALPVLMAH